MKSALFFETHEDCAVADAFTETFAAICDTSKTRGEFAIGRCAARPAHLDLHANLFQRDHA
jgi:hypothetical protein